MIIKKYEAVGLTSFSTFVTVDGKRIDIDFTPGIHYYGKPASYTCKDKAIQDALEASKMFKTGRLRVASVSEKIEPPKEVKIIKETEAAAKDVTPVAEEQTKEFDSLKALQVYLMKEHKISFSEIRSRENAMAKAESLGLQIKING